MRIQGSSRCPGNRLPGSGGTAGPENQNGFLITESESPFRQAWLGNYETAWLNACLHSLFLQFDNDGSGQISEANIKIAMSKFGMTVSAEEIKVIMAEHDEDKDGGISKEEFAKIFGLNPS